MKIEVCDWSDEPFGEISLRPEVFGIEARADILHSVVLWQQAKSRRGTQSVKARGEVSGSSRKITRQKGTGGARHGNRKAPQFRGGGRGFGVAPRDYSYALPRKLRRRGMCCALSLKFAEGKLKVIGDSHLEEPKTKLLVKHLEAMKLGAHESVLFVLGSEVDVNLRRASANLPKIDVLPSIGANVRDILRHDYLVLTRDAIEQLEARLTR